MEIRSGALKEAQLPNANRVVCDGVYLWRKYNQYILCVVPLDTSSLTFIILGFCFLTS